MTLRHMVVRSLRFHLRSHLGVVIGAAVASAALVGALVVGDSVRGSLRARAESRLGAVEVALDSGDRLFTSELASRWGTAEGGVGGLLRLRGTAGNQDGSARAHAVQIHGVRDDFWALKGAAGGASPGIAPGQVLLNGALAAQLSAKTGDTVILRFAKPSALSQDAVVSPRNEAAVAMRLRVGGVVESSGFGDFSLISGQRVPLNAFVNLPELWSAAGVTQRLNQLLVPKPAGGKTEPGAALTRAEARLAEAWTLDDGQVSVRPATGAVEVVSPRIFLDPAVAREAVRPADGGARPAAYPDRWLSEGRPILTYLANAVRSGDRMTPYSMVTAAGAPWTPPDLGDDEIVLNAWLAADLGVQAGAEVELTYFDPEAGARLLEKSRKFKVRSVVPLGGVHADRTLMPEFPGLAKAESTSDWDAGFPLVHRIRDQDERYWKEHRGTPKAFVSLAGGRAMWANRFGDATAVRFLVGPGQEAEGAARVVRDNLRARLSPGDVGLGFRPVRELAMRAAGSGQDFGGLFLGFSLFLVVAALVLTALLFRFGVEQRLPEVGTLVAIGYPRRLIRRLWLLEGLGLALLGTLPGILIGMVYARGLVHGLSTLWKDAVGGVPLGFYATPMGVGVGWASSVAVAVVTLALTLRGQFLRAPRELLSGEVAPPAVSHRKRRGVWGWLALLAGVGIAVAAMGAGGGADPGAFFGAGALILIGGLGILSSWISGYESGRGSRSGETGAFRMSRSGLAVRGVTRRRSRSLSTVALLASGTFLVLAIGAFRLDAERDAGRRDSGTGGFALIGEASLPVTVDLNTSAGLEFYGLSKSDLEGVGFVSCRVRDGDDASCLNLDRAQRPRIVGVPAGRLAELGAFRFVQSMQGRPASEGWRLLTADRVVGSDGVPEVPAIGDASSIQWALGRKMGDALDLVDERGRPFRLRLVGGVAPSILQGSLFIDDAAFAQLFPFEAGYRFFLVDAPSGSGAAVSATLSRALEDVGWVMTPATRRLAEFNAVQNTYLGTFQVLGGLGLLLGSAGLGVVVLRNVLERRSELGLLSAVGFPRSRLVRMVLLEHGALLAFGLVLGAGSAVVAVLPELLGGARTIPWRSLSLNLAGVVLFGLGTAWLATQAAVRGKLTAALRGE